MPKGKIGVEQKSINGEQEKTNQQKLNMNKVREILKIAKEKDRLKIEKERLEKEKNDAESSLDENEIDERSKNIKFQEEKMEKMEKMVEKGGKKSSAYIDKYGNIIEERVEEDFHKLLSLTEKRRLGYEKKRILDLKKLKKNIQSRKAIGKNLRKKHDIDALARYKVNFDKLKAARDHYAMKRDVYKEARRTRQGFTDVSEYMKVTEKDSEGEVLLDEHGKEKQKLIHLSRAQRIQARADQALLMWNMNNKFDAELEDEKNTLKQIREAEEEERNIFHPNDVKDDVDLHRKSSDYGYTIEKGKLVKKKSKSEEKEEIKPQGVVNEDEGKGKDGNPEDEVKKGEQKPEVVEGEGEQKPEDEVKGEGEQKPEDEVKGEGEQKPKVVEGEGEQKPEDEVKGEGEQKLKVVEGEGEQKPKVVEGVKDVSEDDEADDKTRFSGDETQVVSQVATVNINGTQPKSEDGLEKDPNRAKPIVTMSMNSFSIGPTEQEEKKNASRKSAEAGPGSRRSLSLDDGDVPSIGKSTVDHSDDYIRQIEEQESLLIKDHPTLKEDMAELMPSDEITHDAEYNSKRGAALVRVASIEREKRERRKNWI